MLKKGNLSYHIYEYTIHFRNNSQTKEDKIFVCTLNRNARFIIHSRDDERNVSFIQ